MTDVRLPSVEGRWRALAALVAAALMLALFPLGSARAEDRVNMTQLSGADNIAAALAWSTHAHTEAKNVVLGRSDLPPDNLASGLLQGVLDAPLLLTSPNSLHATVEAELERLKAVTVHILGGLSAISASVESKLRSEGYAVRRYSGTTRIETAQAIAQQHGGSATTALLARAFGSSTDPTSAWADALAGGAWSADDSFPVLFTQTETLTASTRQYLTTSRIRTVIILGGTGAVSQAVEDALKAMNITVERVSGATRFATAVEIAKERGFDTAGDAEVTSIVLTDGQHADGWAPGFAAAGFAADKPVVLSNAGALPAETDAWFAGAQKADKLIVAPYVTEAAAKAAADKMGLLKKAAVTLDATSFPNNGNITGKVTPMDDVKSVAVSGPCVTAGAVTPNATTGAFSVPISQNFTPGSCTLTFTVTYKDDSTQTNPFTITITGPGPNATVTDAPELTTVALASTTADHAVVRYTFDEPVTVVEAGNADFPNDFLLHSYAGTAYVPNAPVAPAARSELGTDGKSVLVSFKKAEYERATTAVVLPGAVKDAQLLLNPEGSRGVQALTLPAGQTDGPDLLSISAALANKGDAVTANYVVRVTYVFDRVATSKDVNHYKVVLKDSNEPTPGETLFSGNNSDRHVIEFTKATAAGAQFLTSQANAEAFIANIARGFVDFTDAAPDTYAVSDSESQPNIAHTALSGSAAMESGRPYLTSVQLSPSTNTAKLVFSEPLNTTDDLVEASFFVYDHSRNVSAAPTNAIVDTASDTSKKTVKLTFAAGVLDEQTTAAGNKKGAVKAETGAKEAAFQTLGATTGSHPFAAGATLAPDLQSATRAATSSPDPFGGSSVTQYKVTFRFDTYINIVTDTKFKSYKADGTAGTPFLAAQCAPATTTAVTMEVVCTVGSGAANFAAVRDAVLFAVDAGAVSAENAAGDDLGYQNYASSKPAT